MMMEEYTIKEAAEYLGMTYKQFHYAVSQGYWGLTKGGKKFTKSQLDDYMWSLLEDKLKRAVDDPAKTAQYKAMAIALLMRSCAKDIFNHKELSGGAWDYMARQFSRNAHKITAFVEAHK